MTCPCTDELLAHHLDGDPTGSVPGHLEDCAACRGALLRARRLDAALAEAAGREAQLRDPTPARLEAWLDAAAERGRQGSPPARRPVLARWIGAAALFLAGFAAAWLLWARPASPASAGTQDPAVAGATGDRDPEAGSTRPIPLGSRSRPTAARRPASRSTWSDLARMRLPLLVPASGRLGLDPVRASAALELLETGRLTDFSRWLAQEEPGLALTLAADRARQHGRLVRQLRGRLATSAGDDLRSTVTAALRLGAPSLDREVRRLLRDRPFLAGLAADALARSPSRGERAGLLLDLWGDLVARTGLADDEETARLLFEGQPRGTAVELAAELRRTGHAPRRLRALLAMGVCVEREALPLLLARVTGSRFEEAMAAGWALSRHPITTLVEIADRATRRDQHMLRAVLAGAGSPAATAWIDELELTPEEDAFLRAGSFTPAQFPIAAALFRQRHATGS